MNIYIALGLVIIVLPLLLMFFLIATPIEIVIALSVITCVFVGMAIAIKGFKNLK